MNKTVDENSKAIIAKKVITSTRKYFIPSTGEEIEAKSVESAVEVVEEQSKEDVSEE